MRPSLAIGDFSRATHLSVKMLRHYHRIGLLEPADVDPDTGHRRYTTEQIPTAQVIRRFRAMDMPLEEIQAVIAAPDLDTRNELDCSASGPARREPRQDPRSRSLAAQPPPAAFRVSPGQSRTSQRRGGSGRRRVRGDRRRRRPRPGIRGRLGSSTPPWPRRTSRSLGLEAASTPTTCSPTSVAWLRSSSRARAAVRPMGRVTSLVVPGRRTGHDRAHRTSHRHRPRLRGARHLRHPARSGHRWTDPRVLPRRTARDQRRVGMAHGDWLADLPDRTSCSREPLRPPIRSGSSWSP